MTDYGSLDPLYAEENEYYCEMRPMDVELPRDVLRCGVLLSYDQSGTHL